MVDMLSLRHHETRFLSATLRRAVMPQTHKDPPDLHTFPSCTSVYLIHIGKQAPVAKQTISSSKQALSIASVSLEKLRLESCLARGKLKTPHA